MPDVTAHTKPEPNKASLIIPIIPEKSTIGFGLIPPPNIAAATRWTNLVESLSSHSPHYIVHQRYIHISCPSLSLFVVLFIESLIKPHLKPSLPPATALKKKGKKKKKNSLSPRTTRRDAIYHDTTTQHGTIRHDTTRQNTDDKQ